MRRVNHSALRASAMTDTPSDATPMMTLTSRTTLGVVLLTAACSANTSRSAAIGGASSPARAPFIVVPPTEPREQTADQQVQQVLNRLGFGPRPGDVAKVRALGVDQWIALQLAPDRIDDGAADRIVASYEMLAKPTSEFEIGRAHV